MQHHQELLLNFEGIIILQNVAILESFSCVSFERIHANRFLACLLSVYVQRLLKHGICWSVRYWQQARNAKSVSKLMLSVHKSRSPLVIGTAHRSKPYFFPHTFDIAKINELVRSLSASRYYFQVPYYVKQSPGKLLRAILHPQMCEGLRDLASMLPQRACRILGSELGEGQDCFGRCTNTRSLSNRNSRQADVKKYVKIFVTVDINIILRDEPRRMSTLRTP